MLFFSNYQNKIDKKGRISVPASFRAVLAKQESGCMIVYESLRNPCVEACGLTRFAKMNEQIEQMDPFSEEREAFADTLFGQSLQLNFDSEGRVTLPPHLLEASNIKEAALFVGKGETFEIWNPERYKAHSAEARAVVKKKFHTLMPKGKSKDVT